MKFAAQIQSFRARLLLLLALMVSVATLSAFISNTAAAAFFASRNGMCMELRGSGARADGRTTDRAW